MCRSSPAFLLTALLIAHVVPQVQCEAPGSGNRPVSETALPPRTDLYGDPLPAGALVRLGTLRFRHSILMTVAWSRDGKTLASGGYNSAIRLWDVATGKEVRRLEGDGSTMAWSPDGKMLASGWYSDENKISLFDVTTGKKVRELEGPKDEDGIESVAWSPDGKTLARSYGKTIRLWDATTWKERRTLAGHANDVHSVAWSPDGKTLASGSQDQTIRLWDPISGKEVHRLGGHEANRLVDHQKGVDSVAWSPDGKTLASGNGDEKIIRLWDPATGKEVRRLEADCCIVSWSPDGTTLASGSYDSPIHLWDVATWKEVRRIEGSHRAAWSPDGKILAATHASSIRLWDPATGKEIRPRQGHEGCVASVYWSLDGKVVASGSWDGTVRVWDPTSGKQVRVLNGAQGWVESVAWSPDGKTLASGSEDKTIRLWDPTTGKEVRRLVGHTGKVLLVAWSPDCKTLASGSEDKTIRLWEAATGKEVRRLVDADPSVCSLAWSSDGKMLASWSDDHTLNTGKSDNTIYLWEAATGREIRRLVGHERKAACVVWSPNGKMLVSLSSDKTIRLWEAATGKELRRLDVPGDDVRSAAWSPDGKMLAAATDKGVRLWEVATGMEFNCFAGHEDSVRALAWSPDGRRLASASFDTTLLVWAVNDHPDEPPVRLGPSELESYWADLAGVDPARVQPAIRILIRGRRDSVPFLAQRLKPVASVDPKYISRLIDDLDDNRYAIRQRATDELEKLHKQAGPALQRAQSTKLSLEKRRRLERLLKRLNEWSSEQVRGQRAATVLEVIGTAEARALLELLARGAPADRLTQEAKASLGRLARRPVESAPGL